MLDALRAWLEDKRGLIPPKTPLGKGLGYLHRQWRRLTLFVDDGNIELTNNRRERELRKLVLGRRNWLFAWMDLGGERTARILSIIATAISHDINPRAYLHVVVKLLVEGWPADRLRELLPDRISVPHPELVVVRSASDDAALLLPATTGRADVDARAPGEHPQGDARLRHASARRRGPVPAVGSPSRHEHLDVRPRRHRRYAAR